MVLSLISGNLSFNAGIVIASPRLEKSWLDLGFQEHPRGKREDGEYLEYSEFGIDQRSCQNKHM